MSHKNKSGRIYAASLAFCIFYVRVEAEAFFPLCNAQNSCSVVLVVVVDFIDSFLDSFLQLCAMWAAAVAAAAFR